MATASDQIILTDESVQTNGFRTVGIVGSGIVGAGVAEVVARAGFDVIVASRTHARDTRVAILEALFAETRDPHVSPQPLLRRMVTAKMLGRKTGVGFYDYPKRG